MTDASISIGSLLVVVIIMILVVNVLSIDMLISVIVTNSGCFCDDDDYFCPSRYDGS